MCAQSCPTLCDPMDCSPQAPLPMEFSREEYWSGLPFPSPGDLRDPRVKAMSPALAHRFFTNDPHRKPRHRSTITLTEKSHPFHLLKPVP